MEKSARGVRRLEAGASSGAAVAPGSASQLPPQRGGRPAERLSVRIASSRCPWCHGAVRIESDDWAACRRCLARQHEDCWAEGGACAACGERERLGRVGAPRRMSSPARLVAVVAAVLLTVNAVVHEVVELRSPEPPERESAPEQAASPRAGPRSVEVPDFVWSRLAFLEDEGRLGDALRYAVQEQEDYPNPELRAAAERLRARLHR